MQLSNELLIAVYALVQAANPSRPVTDDRLPSDPVITSQLQELLVEQGIPKEKLEFSEIHNRLLRLRKAGKLPNPYRRSSRSRLNSGEAHPERN